MGRTPFQNCVELARRIAIFRDKWCIICGDPSNPHGHHIWLKSRKIWTVLVDPDFVVRLCGKHHTLSKESAHEQELEFREKIINRIGQSDPDRATKLSRFLVSPHTSFEYKRSIEEKPEWAEIAADLIMRLKITEEHYHMDMANVDETYRGRTDEIS
jgi:hypothetical protein